MYSLKSLSIWLLAAVPLAFALPCGEESATTTTTVISSAVKASAVTTSVSPVSPSKSPSSTPSRAPIDPACTNGPHTRNCWKDGFSIATDFDSKDPPHGRTRTYHLEITNSTLNPDGALQKLAFLINGQYPGPTIFADWGDTVVVNVKNSLRNNGTSMHWHGLRQYMTNNMDGVNGVTECPIAPGETRQYVWKASQHGTSWYHSHFSAQYGEGVMGAIQINGPATANYDEDLGVLPITDWYYRTASEMDEIDEHTLDRPPFPPDNVLINGTGVKPLIPQTMANLSSLNPGNSSISPNVALPSSLSPRDGRLASNTRGGDYFKIKIQKGKKYRLRLINMSVNAFFHVSLDGHPFQVITSDFVPIVPYTTDQLAITIGQRYDVIIDANQPSGNYWLRVNTVSDCGTNTILNIGKVAGAIVSYEDAPNPNAQPTSTGVTLSNLCADETNIVPWVHNAVPQDQFEAASKEIALEGTVANGNLIQWLINGTAMRVDWGHPTLQTVLDGSSNFGPQANVIELPNKDHWYFWVIQEVGNFPLEHPIHLHGHDFYVLGSGFGVFKGDSSSLNFNNPPRRDTATLPSNGYLVLGFPADNPGAWVMHCHIAWHVSEGLSLQFLERKHDIPGFMSNADRRSLNQGCQAWNKYWNGPHPYQQVDSGL